MFRIFWWIWHLSKFNNKKIKNWKLLKCFTNWFVILGKLTFLHPHAFIFFVCVHRESITFYHHWNQSITGHCQLQSNDISIIGVVKWTYNNVELHLSQHTLDEDDNIDANAKKTDEVKCWKMENNPMRCRYILRRET